MSRIRIVLTLGCTSVGLASCSLLIDTNPDGVIPNQGSAGGGNLGTSGAGGSAGAKGLALGGASIGGAMVAGTTSVGSIAGRAGGGAGEGGRAASQGGASTGGVAANFGGAGSTAGGVAPIAAGAGSTAGGTTSVGGAGRGGVGNGGTSNTGGKAAAGGQSSAGAAGASCGTAACTVGAYVCSGAALQHCELNVSGCPTLVTTTTCASTTPVCNASAQRCDCDSSAPATCNGVNARLACSATSGQWASVACPSATPACGNNGVCTACTEHSQCPGSACHLAGAKKGTCFDSTHVYRATTSAELVNAVKNLSVPGELAILAPTGSFTTGEQVVIKGNQEVAIVGGTTRPTWGGNGSWSDARNSMIQVQDTGILYFANIRQQESTPGSTGIGTSPGSIVWIDDVYSSGYFTALSSSSDEMHVRRSFLCSYDVAAIYLYRGVLFMENSVLAPLLNSPENGTGAIMMGAASIILDIRYSTIIGGQSAIKCNTAPQPSGSIRNSILLAYSASENPVPAACGSINQVGNYSPTIYYTSAWFVGPTTGDFHLSAGGKAAVSQTAQWAAGDPTVDIDGQARPTSTVGYPGVDQP